MLESAKIGYYTLYPPHAQYQNHGFSFWFQSAFSVGLQGKSGLSFARSPLSFWFQLLPNRRGWGIFFDTEYDRGEGSTVQWKRSPNSTGSLKALLFPPLLNNVQTRVRKGCERGTTRNFPQSFPLSSTQVVQSYWGIFASFDNVLL